MPAPAARTALGEFLRLWFLGYAGPSRLADRLQQKQGYVWGVAAQSLRGVLDSLLVYLPVTLLHRIPPMQPFIPGIPPQEYYLFLTVATPFVLVLQTFLVAGFIHLALRVLGRPSQLGLIVNIAGFAALVVGAVLIPWDWMWFALGAANQYLLGITHLLISGWSTLIMVVGLRRGLQVPTGLAIALSVASVAVSLPLAMAVMRSPF